MALIGAATLIGFFGWISFIALYDPKSNDIQDPRTEELLSWPRAPLFWIGAFCCFKVIKRLQNIAHSK